MSKDFEPLNPFVIQQKIGFGNLIEEIGAERANSKEKMKKKRAREKRNVEHEGTTKTRDPLKKEIADEQRRRMHPLSYPIHSFNLFPKVL